MATGKIDDESFKTLVYPRCGSQRPEVLVPPQFGVDTAIVRLPNGYEMALTSDPLSLIPSLGLQESAWLSVHLMANDMATTGKAPMYAQFVLTLPSPFSSADFDTYWQYIHRYCSEMGTAITGGHTGRFEGQQSTTAGGGTMITIAPAGEMLVSKGAGEGDVIIITRSSALIATSVLALSFPQIVKNRCGAAVQQEAAGLFYQTSALQAGLTAAALNTPDHKMVTAMHDVTEGGLLGAVYEMALASGCGVLVQEDAVPTGEVQQQVCALFGIDPHYSVGAGSMIIAAKEAQAGTVVQTLAHQGIPATVVGRFTALNKGMQLLTNGEIKPLLHPGTDPYWAAFYDAFAKGLQ